MQTLVSLLMYQRVADQVEGMPNVQTRNCAAKVMIMLFDKGFNE
jgi:hypothetical protein